MLMRFFILLSSRADVTRSLPVSLEELRNAALWDIHDGMDLPQPSGFTSAMEVQNLLRHALSKALSEGIINCLIITDSGEANVQLTRLHEHIFARESRSRDIPSFGLTSCN
jgi:hypothetical protein